MYQLSPEYIEAWPRKCPLTEIIKNF